MFITVKYGNNESLLCNPSCVVVNLLKNIQERSGYQEDNVILDLSDETGLVKDLDLHKYDTAEKYLAEQDTYILVAKQAMDNIDGRSDDGRSTPSFNTQYSYVPLLDGYEELFPNYKLHIPQLDKLKQKRGKSASPSTKKRSGKKNRKK